MPFPRPTLTILRQQVAGDINTALAGADGFLRRANLTVIGTVQAGLANLQYGYLDWIAKQSIPFTADNEYLQAWGALKGVNQGGPEPSTGGTTFTGTVGKTIPALTQMIRSDGAIFQTAIDFIVGGSQTVEVTGTAVVSGAAGNTDIGSLMTLGVAIDGINTNGIVTTQYTGGTDTQSQDSYRSEVMEIYAAPPQGGDAQDYITWSLAVPGVTRAWVRPNGAGSGTVVVYPMFDVSEAAHDGFPQGTDGVAAGEDRDTVAAGDQLAVANYIFGPLRQPVTALVYVSAPLAQQQNFTIDSLSPNTAAMKTAIAAAIVDVFLREGTVGGARLQSGQVGGTIPLASIYSAIDAIPGLLDFVITSPLADIVAPTGYLSVLGTITWT